MLYDKRFVEYDIAMTAKDLRQKFLDFFSAKGGSASGGRPEGHAIIPSASLIPRETDPTVLFTTAGMHPLVPYLLGEDHPGGKRVANIQKCIRTVDIDEVGDNRHLTFFEMMGNWSFGDYFKREAIEWSWEFLTDKKWLGLDPKRIYVTVFRGNPSTSSGQGIPRDDESIKIWQEVFEKARIKAEVADASGRISENVRIIPLGTDDNFWIASAAGPCGPDTEMFYDTRPSDGRINDTFENLVNSERLIEVWNDVFMQYNRQPTTNDQRQFEYIKLKQQNVDTGMGVERTLAVLNGKETVFETELFLPIFDKIADLARIKSGLDADKTKSFRIISDHLKASVFIIADGVKPLNIGRGYVLRRLIRRSVRYGKLLGIDSNFTKNIAEVVIEMYKDFYPEIKEGENKIFSELEKEENKFRETLEKGLKQFESQKSKVKSQNLKSKVKIFPGDLAFDLYQTFGFPLELTKELASEEELEVDEKGFQEEYKKHQELSRTAAAGQFKGGLAEAGEATARLHTATHLLLAALREVLGPHVYQKGSNITPERLRLDFSHQEKLSADQLKKVEDIVNEFIRENVPIVCREMTVEEAKKAGAIGVFESKYGEKVKVYTVEKSAKGGPPYSREICGGPHANSTGELGHFKIMKEESSSAGIRRIKAVLE